YGREGYNDADKTWYTTNYSWGIYHAHMLHASLAAEMAYHNGMTNVFALTDAGSEPALLRTFKKNILSRSEIDTDTVNTFGHPIIGYLAWNWMAYRRYNDPLINNGMGPLLTQTVAGPGGQIINTLDLDDVPHEVLRFFAYPRRVVWSDGDPVAYPETG